MAEIQSGHRNARADCKNIHTGSDLRLNIQHLNWPLAKVLKSGHKEQGQVPSDAGMYQQSTISNLGVSQSETF